MNDLKLKWKCYKKALKYAKKWLTNPAEKDIIKIACKYYNSTKSL